MLFVFLAGVVGDGDGVIFPIGNAVRNGEYSVHKSMLKLVYKLP